MHIGFYLKRETYLKIMGALIDLCVQRGHEVLLACVTEGGVGDKAYQTLDRTKLSYFVDLGCEILPVEGISDLRNQSLDVLVTLEGFHTLQGQFDEIESLRSEGTKIVSLTHFFEIAKRPLEALEIFDKTYYISEYAKDLHVHLRAQGAELVRVKRALEHKVEVAGSPMFDQIGRLSREDARAELGIPADRKMVLLMAPVISSITPWRFHVWGEGSRLHRTRAALAAGRINFIPEIWLGKPFPTIMQWLREFCDRENAWLVIKSRGKQNDPKYLSEKADLYISGMDDSYFPLFTTYRLLAAADLCITVNSMAAVEAVAAGVPCLNIQVPHLDLAVRLTATQIAYQTMLLGGAPETLMNYFGVVMNIDRAKVDSALMKMGLDDLAIDEKKREEYIQKFLGIKDRSSSERILAGIESLSAPHESDMHLQTRS